MSISLEEPSKRIARLPRVLGIIIMMGILTVSFGTPTQAAYAPESLDAIPSLENDKSLAEYAAELNALRLAEAAEQGAVLGAADIAEPVVTPVIPTVESWQNKVTRMAREQGKDPVLMHSMIFCESSARPHVTQHNRRSDGSVSSTDHGLFQINDYFWSKDAARLGLDFKNNPHDNVEMAFYILDKQPNAWKASAHCHNRSTTRNWVYANVPNL